MSDACSGTGRVPVEGLDPTTSHVRAVVESLASVLGLAAYVLLIGGILSWIRLTAAHLPADATVSVLDKELLLAVGLRAILFAAAVFTVVCAISYLAAHLAWKRNPDAKQRWTAVVTRGPRAAARLSSRDLDAEHAGLGEGAVKIVAGFNIIVIAAVVGLALARLVDLVFPTTSIPVIAFFVLSVAVGYLVARADPLRNSGWAHWFVGALVLVIAALGSAPIGVLVLACYLIARLGRVIARLPRPDSISSLLRSPLPWGLLTIYTLVALAWVAIPPVSYPRAVIGTPAGERIGGYLARTADGVWIVTCRGLANATSIDERTVLINADDVKTTTLGGEPYRVDEGDRPSLVALALRAAGFNVPLRAVFHPELRDTRPTCGGQVAAGNAEQQLGPGVLIGPGPPRGVASGGEAPVQRTTPPAVAMLARKYQPTVEVTVADRFWPVSVGSVLSNRTAASVLRKSKVTCLVHDTTRTCPITLASLTAAGGAADDYIDLPGGLPHDPTSVFQSFVRGQGASEDAIRNWLVSPTALNPWASAQVYFYDAGVTRGSSQHHVPGGLRTLQYWFFYPYNYYPTVVAPRLMPTSPLAGDLVNTDLHQGDWEHVSVLLDPRTLRPRFLYMARHDTEGEALRWNGGGFSFDNGHPIVQASFGGHASYPNRCQEHPRAILRNLASDWVVCGSGRFAFRAATTPLVDLARASWACWPGHFGRATPAQLRMARLPESDPRRALAKYVTVAGPVSPLRQAENAGACRSG